MSASLFSRATSHLLLFAPSTLTVCDKHDSVSAVFDDGLVGNDTPLEILFFLHPLKTPPPHAVLTRPKQVLGIPIGNQPVCATMATYGVGLSCGELMAIVGWTEALFVTQFGSSWDDLCPKTCGLCECITDSQHTVPSFFRIPPFCLPSCPVLPACLDAL
jgi:hypothetical protein